MRWPIQNGHLNLMGLKENSFKFSFFFPAFEEYSLYDFLFWLDLWAVEGANKCINIWLISDLARSNSSSLIKICKFGHQQQILTGADIKPKCQTWETVTFYPN